jgi:hypothetical protein
MAIFFFFLLIFFNEWAFICSFIFPYTWNLTCSFFSFVNIIIAHVSFCKNSKIELYCTWQQLSQYDCLIKIFFQKHKDMYKQQSLCKLLSQNVINMSLLKVLVLIVFFVYFRWHESASKCHTCTKKVRGRINPLFRKWRSGKWRLVGVSRTLVWGQSTPPRGPWPLSVYPLRVCSFLFFKNWLVGLTGLRWSFQLKFGMATSF